MPLCSRLCCRDGQWHTAVRSTIQPGELLLAMLHCTQAHCAGRSKHALFAPTDHQLKCLCHVAWPHDCMIAKPTGITRRPQNVVHMCLIMAVPVQKRPTCSSPFPTASRSGASTSSGQSAAATAAAAAAAASTPAGPMRLSTPPSAAMAAAAAAAAALPAGCKPAEADSAGLLAPGTLLLCWRSIVQRSPACCCCCWPAS